jgi:hypothetical protein
MTGAEARKLVDAVLPANEKRTPSLVIEVDREHDGCVVYHVYRDTAREMALLWDFGRSILAQQKCGMKHPVFA